KKTLLHELCHAAAWVVDHASKPPHGERFWMWARKAMAAHPGVPVTTCHSYNIHYKHRFACAGTGEERAERWGGGGEGEERGRGEGCGAEFGRHSKSIDIERQA
ncbi:unnamed protein product, partial [Discosporangium mesarthrocarpum]